MPLERVSFNGDHLGLGAHIATDLRGDELVDAGDHAHGAVVLGELCDLDDLGLLSLHEGLGADAIHRDVEHVGGRVVQRDRGRARLLERMVKSVVL